MDITVLTSSDPTCDKFVERMPNGSLEHLPLWSFMIEKTFGHKSFYLVAREGQEIRGILPLMQIRSRLFGNRMVSQAFSNYGGPLANEPDALEALYDHAVELATDRGCESIEFHNLVPLTYDLLQSRDDKITMHLPLMQDPDELWRSFRPEVRNQIRKAKKSHLVSICGGIELISDFWSLWSKRMHELGTPCYPRKLFYNIFQAFPKNVQIFLVQLDDLTVGGAFVYCYKGLVQIRWAATLIEYNRLCPNNLLYWSVMKHYCLAGASTFDFGRSTVGSTQHKFKKQWGAKPIQLYYQYWSPPEKQLSLITPDNPKYRKKVEMWKKLPLWMTRLAGPYISRSLA